MMGLVAPLLAGIALKNPVFVLAAVPYLLRARGRNASLVAFYAYALALALTVKGGSIYEWAGLKTAVLTSASTFLLLDEVLGGVNLGRDRLVATALLVASAVSDLLLVPAMVGAVMYSAWSRFGRTSLYLIAWLAGSAGFLYLLREKLSDPVVQSFVIIGLGIAFLLAAERNDVEFIEVGLREEK
ncbi:hypothetical protein [Thermococcus sp. MV11]|uniref:hypothetical protein n=1 Tax=Thermococcus sp. MV11 TaxID=1638267 RepID=UPI00142FBB25|nr:hypothetical protein [Thermococcus sp. MV11]NJE03867.1 hypothetical protein [Thermococcus sp. MV11]